MVPIMAVLQLHVTAGADHFVADFACNSLKWIRLTYPRTRISLRRLVPNGIEYQPISTK
jgi:hypothetical protein